MGIRESNAARVLNQGSSHGEIAKNSMASMINRQFSSNPSYFEVKINDVTCGVHIIDDASSTNQTNHNSKYIVMQPSHNLKVGDIVDYDDNKWLCVACEKFNDIYFKGKILKAEHSISIYDKNSNLFEIPICVESSVQLYRMQNDTNKYFTELGDTVIARMANNEISSLINIDDVYQLGRNRYKVRSVQDLVETGLLVVKLEITTDEVETTPEADKEYFNINP